MGKRTEALGILVTYPFIVFLVLLISRNRYFDRWDWSTPLVLSLLALAVFALIPAFSVRRSAERARDAILARLRGRRARELGRSGEDAEQRAQQVEVVAEQIRSTRFGAFAPWRRHPLIGAVLIPFGGIGAITLLELFGVLGL